MNRIAKPCLSLLLIINIAANSALCQGPETLHIHTDREIYLSGETVYFKAYLFHNNLPSLSTNLYAGFYDQNGRLLQQKTYPIFFGTAHGDFQVPDSFAMKAVLLRFFTKNMLTSDSNNATLKVVHVYQRPTSETSLLDTQFTRVNIEVFPEGGQLVPDVINHIVFKASVRPASSNKLIGTLTNDTGNLIDSVMFGNDGLAKLQFTPAAGSKYFFKWGSDSLRIAATETNSAALHTEISGDNIYYIITRNKNIPRLSKLKLQIKDAVDIIYTEAIDLGSKLSFGNKISTIKLPTGLLRINLIDNQDNVLQGKYILNYPTELLFEAKILEQSKQEKGKNRIQIQLNDTSINFLSAAIIDENFMYSEAIGSIKDELLTGFSNDYLTKENYNATKVDAFLQTNASYQYSTGKLATDNYLNAFASYTSTAGLPPRSSLALIVNDTSNGRQFFNLNQSPTGTFSLPGLIFYDSIKFYYQLNRKDLTDKINLSVVENIQQPSLITPPITSPFIRSSYHFQKRDSLFRQFAENSSTKDSSFKTIETVIVKSKYENPITKRLLELDQKYSFGMYRGLARGVQFNLIDDPNADSFIDLFSYLAYKIPSVRVERMKIDLGGGDSIMSKAFISVRASEKVPLALLIDERPSTFDMLESIPVSQIAYVKAITGIFIGSSITSNVGAVLVYTKKPDDFQSKTPGMKYTFLKGYNSPLSFTQPNYSSPESLNKKDYRPTLYWNPDIIMDKNNQKFIIEYFNNDLSKNPILIIKGINEDGKILEFIKKLE